MKDVVWAALFAGVLLAYGVMVFAGDLLPVPLWLAMFAASPFVPPVALVSLLTTIKIRCLKSCQLA